MQKLQKAEHVWLGVRAGLEAVTSLLVNVMLAWGSDFHTKVASEGHAIASSLERRRAFRGAKKPFQTKRSTRRLCEGEPNQNRSMD